jgi:hypothetical protein
MHPNTEAIKAMFEKMRGRKIINVWTQSGNITQHSDKDFPLHTEEERVVIDFEGPHSIYIKVAITEEGTQILGFGEYD